ncbi:MAG: LPS export ABC transporter periplasmic protein LptC [Bacteroidales bacterium]|nr:LPS export ABC transporter periplasmic protein LptC [Bacteroidales bacterium]MBR6161525.1 LPS export ABC transporter periplasmic protein LptC [Bacteroidales bacterium]
MMFFVGCSSSSKEKQLLEYNGRYPDESAENMVITTSDSGRTSFIVKAPLMNSYSGDSSYMDCPKGVTIISFNEMGRRQAVLTAGYACAINNAIYKASKNVVICDVVQGDTLETEEINWDQRSKTIYSNVLVKQKKADGSVNYGDGFTADEHFTKYTIIHPRGEINGFDF